MERQPPIIDSFLSWERRVADKEEMRLEVQACKRARQAGHTHSEPSGLRIAIRTFERNDDDARAVRLDGAHEIQDMLWEDGG